MTFEVLATEERARRGRLTTEHGVVETPAFMPVGTLGAVKGLAPVALEECGASVMLANLYHLALRPGIEVIADLGGLHAFTGWRRPILTDSGGYQVFSLSGMRRLDADGVTFQSVHDGGMVRFTPESVVEWQARLGVDLAMVLDECPPWPVTEREAASSWDRTLVWARRSIEARQRCDFRGKLFGIVQGSFYEAVRRRAAAEVAELPFDGFAIGGVSVGEAKGLGRDVIDYTTDLLPADRPRYLMGLGTPDDLAFAVSRGIDLFDCVLPARNARHGYLFTAEGPLRIKNARFRRDDRPLDDSCGCPTCRRNSRAFLHHLFRTGEMTGRVLATMHNVRFFLDFMEQLRKALEFGSFAARARELTAPYQSEQQPRPS